MNIPPNTPLAYVILHHTGIPAPHFDLLLDVDPNHPLWTWQLPTHPSTWHTSTPIATRIADHRRLYLTYEGEISNHRGQVTRVAAGAAQCLTSTPTHLAIELHLSNARVTLNLPTAVSNPKSEI